MRSPGRTIPAAATARLIDDYTEKFAHPYAAAARGYIDDVIDPRDTRPRLIEALRTLRSQARPEPGQEAREHPAVTARPSEVRSASALLDIHAHPGPAPRTPRSDRASADFSPCCSSARLGVARWPRRARSIPTWRRAPRPSSARASARWRSTCWGTISPPPPTTGGPGSSWAGSTCSTPATGTCTATGAIPTACCTSSSPPPRWIRRCGSRSIPAWCFRGVTEMDRALVMVEDSGWDAASGGPAPARTPPSCPGTSWSWAPTCSPRVRRAASCSPGASSRRVSVWYGSLQHAPLDILPIRPDLYATDSLYRLRMAAAMGVDPSLPVQRALAPVADQPDHLPELRPPTSRPPRRSRGCRSGWSG